MTGFHTEKCWLRAGTSRTKWTKTPKWSTKSETSSITSPRNDSTKAVSNSPLGNTPNKTRLWKLRRRRYKYFRLMGTKSTFNRSNFLNSNKMELSMKQKGSMISHKAFRWRMKTKKNTTRGIWSSDKTSQRKVCTRKTSFWSTISTSRSCWREFRSNPRKEWVKGQGSTRLARFWIEHGLEKKEAVK